ncbi:hypothetical protein ACHAWF_012476 [Thalassiosira exigua]
MRGGQPEVVFFYPNLPNPGKGTSKLSKTTTMITGSNAAREALPPHFQFQTDAKADEGQRFRNEMTEWMLNVLGKFGGDAIKLWPCTFGMNSKGGMDDDEFYKYSQLDSTTLSKYQDCSWPTPDGEGGQWSRTNMCRTPGHSATVGSVSVSRCTKHNSGVARDRLELRSLQCPVPQELGHGRPTRIRKQISVSLVPWLLGLVVFGGKDPKTKVVIPTEDSAFERGFSVASMEEGAASLTRKCMFDKKVRSDIDDADDEVNAIMHVLQEGNHLSVQILNPVGYQGDLLKATIKEVSKPKHVTEPHLKERIVLHAKAKSHSAKFTATGGGHLTSDD